MDNKKRVYTFGNGKAEGNAQMREVLGGKGANCAEMNLVGVPVPPGFTITTDTCNEYYQVGQEKIIELLNDEVLADIASAATDLFERVAGVIALRQHGNNVVPMNKGEVRDFCMSVYEVTKILLEV